MTKIKKKSTTVESIKPLRILMYPKDAMIWDRTTEILQALNTKQDKQRARNDQVILNK